MVKDREEVAPLSQEQLRELKVALQAKRNRVLAQVRAATKQAGIDDLRVADEMDQAAAGYEQAFEHRLRDREAFLVKKIDRALERIYQDEYDECENCGASIGYHRLKARPEARFCIECKEEQEKVERMYEKRRRSMTSFE